MNDRHTPSNLLGTGTHGSVVSTCSHCGGGHVQGSLLCPSFWIGRTVGERYRLDAQLGSGGMGSVYAGEDARTGRTVAVKLVMPLGSSGDQMLKRIQREIEILGRLAGLPGIVQILDCGTASPVQASSAPLLLEVPFFVMERLVGVNFRQLFRQEPRTITRICLLLAQVADVVHAAHQRGVLHRDLKPDNLFLVQQEGLEEVRVLDFGISKATFSEEQQPLTGTHQYLGTVQYSSPEQFANFRSVEPRSDVYALGAILYVLLTGRHAVAGADSMAMCVNVSQGKIARWPALLRPDVPDWLDALVAECLAFAPAQRPATAADVARRLRQGLAELPVHLPVPYEGTLLAPIQAILPSSADGAASLATAQTLQTQQEVLASDLATAQTTLSELLPEAQVPEGNTATRTSNPAFLEALTPTHRHKTGEIRLERTEPGQPTGPSTAAPTRSAPGLSAATTLAQTRDGLTRDGLTRDGLTRDGLTRDGLTQQQTIQDRRTQDARMQSLLPTETPESLRAVPSTQTNIPNDWKGIHTDGAQSPHGFVESSSPYDVQVLAQQQKGLEHPPAGQIAPRRSRLRALTGGVLVVAAGLLVASLFFPASRPSQREEGRQEGSTPRAHPSGEEDRSERVVLPALTMSLGSTPQEVQAALTWCQTQVKDCRADLYQRELGAHRVQVGRFWMARDEVTVGAYVSWLRALPGLHVSDEGVLVKEGQPLLLLTPEGPVRWTAEGRVEAVADAESLPITHVPWQAARRYCQAQQGDLPTEAQWERAARGAQRRLFPWGEALPACETAVLWRSSGGACAAMASSQSSPARAAREENDLSQGASFLAPVGKQTGDRTPEGVQGMGGNVSEWVLDGFVGAYPPCVSPCIDLVVTEGPMRVVRGGNAKLPFESARAAGRSRAHQDIMADNIGLRCVWPDKG